MPRPRRASPGGYCYHVLNRGNARLRVSPKPADYEAFERLFDQAHERFSMRRLAWCLMPNHFHLVVWPRQMPLLACPAVRRPAGRLCSARL